jgi:hypothetical protein
VSKADSEPKMNTETNTASSWWTQEGFILKSAPQAYVDKPESSDPDNDLAQVGYEKFGALGNLEANEPALLHVEIYRHKDHFLVEIWNETYQLSQFFVSDKASAAFFATWYPDIVRAIALDNQSRHLSVIAKTLVAFVRHGHGLETISEYGGMSLDERRSHENLTRNK